MSLFAQITDGVKPTLSELEKFEDQPEGIDLEVVTETTGRQPDNCRSLQQCIKTRKKMIACKMCTNCLYLCIYINIGIIYIGIIVFIIYTINR